MIVAQLTDTHIRPHGRLAYRKVDTARYLEAAVQHLQHLPIPIEAVLFTGDLVDFGTDAEYERLLGLLAPLSLPIYPIPGNHDDRDAMRRAFAGRAPLPPSGPLCYVVDNGPVRLVMVDSTEPGQPYGLMSEDRLGWLDETLSRQPQKPAIVAMHHPPFVNGIRHMDVQNCGNSAELERLVERHPQVLTVVCGHVHRTVFTGFAGRTASIGPSPAHAVHLDFEPSAIPSFRMDPPGLHIHCWQSDGSPYGRVVTHVSFIGTFDGPYPFFDAAGALID